MSASIMDMKPQDLSGVLFIADVIDNKDPEQEGEVQIRIPLRMDGIPDEHLPWARPQTKGTFFKVPDIGERIYILFQGGSIYHPIYFERAIPPNGVNVFSSDYPNTWGMSDGKNYIRVNKNTGVFEIINQAGAKLVFDPQNGNLEVPANMTIKAGNNATIDAGDNVNIKSGKNTSINATQNITANCASATLTASGSVSITGTGSVSITGTGSVSVSSTGSASISAPAISLG